jgi:hypothetical protein
MRGTAAYLPCILVARLHPEFDHRTNTAANRHRACVPRLYYPSRRQLVPKMRNGERKFWKLLPMRPGLRLVVVASEVQAVEGGATVSNTAPKSLESPSTEGGWPAPADYLRIARDPGAIPTGSRRCGCRNRQDAQVQHHGFGFERTSDKNRRCPNSSRSLDERVPRAGLLGLVVKA